MPPDDIRLWRKLSRRLFRPVQNEKGQTVALVTPDGLFRVDSADPAAAPATAPVVAKTGSYGDLLNIPNFAKVATTGDYADLSNRPALFSGRYSELAGTPSLAPVATSGQYADLYGKPALFSGAYEDLTGKPALFNGDYAALTNRPELFDGRYASLTGAPSLAAVATSGNYADLSNRPALAPVATSGRYIDLTGTPAIPGAAQRIRVQTTTAGTYTWTFPIPYATGARPVITLAVEEATAGALFNIKITALTNTSVTIQVMRMVNVTVASINVLGAATAAQAFVHLTAIAP